MKFILLVVFLLVVFFLAGCASKCPDCLTITPSQLGAAMQKAWGKGWDKGFSDGEDAETLKRLKSL